MKKAEAAIRKGMGESFLQLSEANVLSRVVQSSKLSTFDAEEITAFLQGKEQGSSGEIVGILSQMAEDMEKDLAEATETENAAVADFEGLVAAKAKEIAAATTAIEDKTERTGKSAVDIVNAKNDLEDAQEALADDTNYLAELKKTCAEQATLFDQIKETRSQELAAIGMTVKILNDDDALDLFKKTLSLRQSSFLQTGTQESVRARARVLIKAAQENNAEHLGKSSSAQMMSQFMLMALSGKKAGFEKVVAMMDKFVETLKNEQKDDDAQREYCNKEFEDSADNEADLKRKIGNLETSIEEGKEAVSTLKDAIAALEQGIKDLDTVVAEATATRKEESKEYTETKAGNSAAVQLLEVAKNQLNKFYNPKTYKAPPKRELTEEERLYVASGGVLTTPAPGGIAGTGIAVFSQLRATLKDAPPPPPAAIGAYKKQDASGPVQMLENLMNDLKLEMKEDDMEEKAAQKDYEELMSESATKRATDAKTIVEKETQKADAEERVAKAVKDHKASQKELMALVEYITGLHASCDFLVQNYDLRKEARASEIESIQKAKAVLNGADYSFMQVESKTRFLHPEQAHKCEQDAQRRLQLLQSLTVLASDVNEACTAMGKDACPKVQVPKQASWGELDDLFDALALAGKKVF